jgi:glutamate racemase
MHHLPDRKHFTLLVTDSGLGGLTICAEMVNQLVRRREVSDLTVVYFNAWPYPDKGYNTLDDMSQRVRVFKSALRTMNQYCPDLICIACNTLSVLFHQGNLAGSVQAPVEGIIDVGVAMIADKLHHHPGSVALILGTRTTILSDAHKKRLVKLGFAKERIVQQHCHGLAGAIERNPGSPEVQRLVNQFMAEAAALLAPGIKQIHAALCCTHYDHCQALIKKTLARTTGAKVDIINPNQAMGRNIKIARHGGRFSAVNLNVKVVSKVRLSPKKIEAITPRIEHLSPPTARALQNYMLIPDLFDG